jgi:hypothetical protein
MGEFKKAREEFEREITTAEREANTPPVKEPSGKEARNS